MSNSSTVLKEYNRVFSARHILALVNFLAILAGTVVTWYFLSLRGIALPAMAVIYGLIAINVVQFGLCLADFITKKHFGVYVKALVPINYSVGGVWVLLWVLEMVLCTLSAGFLRIDLIAVAGVQLVTALVAYLLWPSLDRRALDAMMLKSVRDEEDLRTKKAKHYVTLYSLLVAAVIIAQAGALFLYRIPPKVYDLFDNSRALSYELNDTQDGYVVTGIYSGTSPLANIPASYNNLPVVGIRSGALAEEDVKESEKIRYISFGTPTEDENGNTSVVSYLQFIDSGAIVNNQIESLTIPASVTRIGGGNVQNLATNPPPAIVSSSLKTIVYEAQADFELFDFQCSALRTVTMSGTQVGAIVSVEGLSNQTTIEVSKDIYNTYRENNMAYSHNFRPILEDNEFCVDFYTDCDVYVESIIANKETTVGYDHLGLLTVDTSAYNAAPDHHELGTDGAKPKSAFRGWYTDPAFITEYSIPTNQQLKFSGNLDLYAKWVDEYTAELDWGNYEPNGVDKIQHWTDERAETLPVYNSRTGYADGVQWHIENANGAVVKDNTTRELHQDLKLYAVWQLDRPEKIDIDTTSTDNSTKENGEIMVEEDGDQVTFVYDENRYVTLSPVKGTHTLNENQLTYRFIWTRLNGEEVSALGNNVRAQDVAASDTYTLTVEVTAVDYGEKASASTDIVVVIERKPLNIAKSGIRLTGLENEYSSQEQTPTLSIEKDTLSQEYGVRVDYHFYNRSEHAEADRTDLGGTVRNVGEYYVEAVFSKSNSADRANYTEETIGEDFTIIKKQLTKATWQGVKEDEALGEEWNEEDNSITYNGKVHTIELVLDKESILGNDTVHFTYQEGSNAQTRAGKYQAVVTGLDNPNYDYKSITETQKSWEIKPKEIKVARWEIGGMQTSSVTYDGTEHTVYAAVDGAVEGDEVEFKYSETETDVTHATNAGSYRSTVSGVDNTDYTLAPEDPKVSLSWTITKRSLTVSMQSETLTYNGEEQGIKAVITGFVASEISQFNKDFFKFTALNLTVTDQKLSTGFELYFKAKNAGHYTVTISDFDPDSAQALLKNYQITSAGSQLEQSFDIGKKSLEFNPNFRTVTYNGLEQNLYLAVEGIVAADFNSVDYSRFDTTAVGGERIGSTFCLVYKGTNATNYPVSVTSFEDTNYQFSSYSGSLTIQKKELSITGWSITDKSKTSSTSELHLNDSFVYNYSGYDITYTLTGQENGEEVTLTLQNQSGKDVKSYATKATLPEEYSNYTLKSENTTISWSITPYTVNISWKQGEQDITDNKSFVYTGADIAVVPDYKVLGDDELQIEYESGSTFATTAKNVGNYTAKITTLGNKNYQIGSGDTLQWKITPATVTVSFPTGAVTYTYNGKYQAPAFTLSGLCDGDTASASVVVSVSGGKLSGPQEKTLTYTSGSYSLTESNGVCVDAGTYTVKVTGIKLSDENSGNYLIASSGSSKEFTIGKAPLTLSGTWKWANESKPEDGIYQPGTSLVYNKNTYTVTTEIASGLVQRLSASSNDQITLNYSGNQGDQANDYTAEVIGINGTYADNYKLPSTGLKLSWKINPKKVAFTWSNDSLTYNGDQLTITASYTTGATTDDDNKVYSGDTLTITYANNSNTGTNVAGYTARIEGIGNNNYTFLSSDPTATKSWNITPLAVTLTWSADITYNGKAQYPTASYTYRGQKYDVTSYSYPAGATNVGSYSIEATGLGNNNFTLNGATGVTHTYNIIAKVVSLDWVVKGTAVSATSQSYTYDGKLHEFEAKPQTGVLCGSDSLTFTYDATPSFTNAGSYTFKVTEISDGVNHTNYTLVGGSGHSVTINVQKQGVTVTWTKQNGGITYDAVDHSDYFSATMKGVSDGKSVTCKVNISQPSVKNVGKYTFTATVGADSDTNYTTDGAQGLTRELEITKKRVSITWQVDGGAASGSSTSFTYKKGQTHKLTAVIGNTAGGESLTPVYSGNQSATVTAGGIANADTYTITVTGLSGSSANNYTVDGATNVSYTLTINKQEVDVKWESNSESDGLTGSGASWTRVYDGKAHSLKVTVTGKDDKQTVSATVSGSAGTNVGTYSFTVGLSDNNYILSSSNIQQSVLKITRAEASIAWGTTTFVYDGEGHTLTPTLRDVTNNRELPAGEYTKTLSTQTNVQEGGYSMSVTLNGNYYFAGGQTVVSTQTMTITPATASVTDWGTLNFTYDGTLHTANPTVEANGKALSAGSDYTITGNTATNVVSSQTVKITLKSSNYLFADKTTSTTNSNFTVKAAQVSVDWGTLNFTYNGTEHTVTPTVTANGKPLSLGTDYTLSGNTCTNAGEQDVTVTLRTNNYTFAGGQTSEKQTLTVDKATATLVGESESFDYDGDTHSLTVSVTAVGISKLVEGTDYTINNNSQSAEGAHTVTITLSGNFKFADGSSEKTLTLTINHVEGPEMDEVRMAHPAWIGDRKQSV